MKTKFYLEKKPTLCNDCPFCEKLYGIANDIDNCILNAYRGVVVGTKTKHIRPQNCPLRELKEYCSGLHGKLEASEKNREWLVKENDKLRYENEQLFLQLKVRQSGENNGL